MSGLNATRLSRLVIGLALLVGLVLLLAACEPIQSPGATLSPGASVAQSPVAGGSPAPTAAPTAAPSATPAPTPLVLAPAQLKADPISVLAWLFTPVYQAFLMLLVAIDLVVHDVGLAIILTTLIVRTALVPLMRRQMVSMRQMQAIQPEIKEIQRRFGKDRLKAQQAQAALMKERGISQAGCLVAMLPLFLILPMYQVISEGLRAADVTTMVTVFGAKVLPVDCPSPPIAVLDSLGNVVRYQPCLNPTIPWLGGINAAGFEGLIPLPFTIPLIGLSGISVFALFYTLVQLIASRMALPPHVPGQQLDQSAQTSRALAIWLPLITILYGNVIPVGVFIYLIVSTIYQMVQQFFTTGWGGMFPLFGWTPAFAVDHKPRFPVAAPAVPASTTRPAATPAPKPERSTLGRTASANATIRQRGRQGRRGRRR